ncbi:glutathione peroxidase [Oceanisphaera pacifica]|uniref:Glutathione peroxidase n=1 Tax=Oceanisphaera pacifica TaxID=2818389 RepID=A0ABS3NGB1_9GAMM|nr:glutathione peroxidase [Oceanisphaera pacifica]MBO1519582.1 glutathione peroxidase [Oceanisphaera pacifica]
MKALLTSLCGLLLSQPVLAAEPDTSALFDHQIPRLHSSETLNMQPFAGKPMLVVNTASHCGFTGQFEGLEALHQQYQGQGLKVVGFPSNDFKQEAKDEAETAEVCFVNFGVTFDMAHPIKVRGKDAHPIFQEITRQSGKAPRWNFYKFVINKDGAVTAVFGSRTKPSDPKLQAAIQAVL